MRGWAAAIALGVGVAIMNVAPDSRAATVSYLVCFSGVVVAAWRGARGGGPWFLIAAAMTSYLIGDIIGDVLALTDYAAPVGPADVFWLGGYPLLGAALLSMGRRRAPGQSRASALDGLTLTAACSLCFWQIAVSPAVADSLDATAVMAMLYPLGDVILLACVLYLVLAPGRRGVPTYLLLGGVSLTLGGDLMISLVDAYWPWLNTEHFDGVLLLANALIVAAALHPQRDELVTPVQSEAETIHPARASFLGAALLTGPLMAILGGGDIPLRQRLVLTTGTVVAIGASLARFVGAVTEQARMQKLLARQAATDVLTGIANRRTLIGHLERDYRPAGDTVLFYLDLDGFKAINDDLGHAAGDAVLVAVAGRLRACVRTGDVVARLGGDEFAVLCHRLEQAAARELADRMALAVAEPIGWADHSMIVTASIGISSALDCPNGDALIAAADHAMFAVKRARRATAAAGF
jgi:diguanylate cyclase (GGDEF)-like protein